MVTDAQLFMDILGAALEGRSVADDPVYTGERLSRLAAAAAHHHLLPLFYEAVHTLPQATAMPPHIGSAVRQQVMGQALRTQQLFDLYRHLENRQLRPLLLKGLVCRSLYPQGDHRPSSDEDLLIPNEDHLRCCQALEELGYVTDDPPAAFERTYRAPEGGLRIELHRQLFDPDSPVYGSWNNFFENAHRQAQTLLGLPTLCPTDHMLYLLLHAFKHFLHSGFGLRQVCDIVLYARAYGERIDWPYIETTLEKLRADRFAAAIFLLGQRFWQIPAPISRQADPLPLLEDLLEAGVYGGSTAARKRSSNITLSAASGHTSGGWLHAIFPPLSSLSSRFPYLRKRPWLLPWAWLCRILTYKTNRSSAETLQIGARRLDLLRLYGIIEK